MGYLQHDRSDSRPAGSHVAGRVLIALGSNMVSTIGEQRKAGSQEEYTHERKGLFEGMSARKKKKKTFFLCRHEFMRGHTIIVRVLRPLVSIRKRVGMVATTWTAPYPRDAYNASVAE